MRTRVILAEDHEAVAEKLRHVLDSQFDVVASVTDGYGLVGAALVLKPDAIVADVSMPGMDGIAAAQWILKANPNARIVLVTVHREPELVQRAMDIGVLGYVIKPKADEGLVPAVEAAIQGKRHVPQMTDPAESE